MIYFDKYSKTYKSSLLKKLPHGFGTKQLGDGRDIRVIKKLLAIAKVNYRNIVVPKQTHSTNASFIDKDEARRSSKVRIFRDKAKDFLFAVNNADALITKEKENILTVITADCVPMIFVDRKTGLVAISHQGWKGTLSKFPLKLMKKLTRLGSRIESIIVVIGPSIGPCCYRVDSKRLKKFMQTFGSGTAGIDKSYSFLNLAKINYNLLLKSGVNKENIDMALFCTSCQKDKFWSYRRDGKIEGEMISFVTSRL